jgi:phosphatidylserine/phosphatidylglycerophosphate/cardiolipin synthase-like enzyme
MFVFDGEYAVVDGQNMTGIQTLSNGSNNLINDMGIGIEGPLVQEVAHRFIAHWKKAKRKKLPQRLSDFYAQKKSQAESFKSQEAIKEGINKKTGVCRLVTSDPGFKKRAILPMYFSYVQSAQNYLFFNQIDHRFQDVSGNSVGKSFLKEVIKAANGNKDLRVDMLTNQWKLPTEIKLPEGMGVKPTFFSFMISKPGKLIIEMPHLQIGTARENLLPLIEKNNFHWWASAIYMHAKTMMVDNIATFIGSYNINRGSENFSYEQVVVCHDEKLAQSMQKSIVQDLLNSIPIPIQKEN